MRLSRLTGKTTAAISCNMTLDAVLKDICEEAFFGHSAIDIGTRMSDSESDQPLHAAVVSSNPDYVRVLLAHGADPNSRGDMGQTPLHYAATRSNKAIIEMLLAAGASLHALNDFNRTPLESCESVEVRELLENWRPKQED